MSALWAAFGVLVLGVGLLDVFVTALNYDEAGFLATRLCRLQWRLFRGVTRRLPQRWRPVVLRQVMGLSIVLHMTIWLGSIVVGFGLSYLSQMHGANFDYDGRDLGDVPFSAMYFSAAQLSTVGTAQISLQTDWLRALSIAETLTGLGLVTLSRDLDHRPLPRTDLSRPPHLKGEPEQTPGRADKRSSPGSGQMAG